VTYVIIKKLEEEGETFELEDMNLSSLWFADDSLSISKSMEDAKKNLEIIKKSQLGIWIGNK